MKFLSNKTLIFAILDSNLGKPNKLYKYDLEKNMVIQEQEYPQEFIWYSYHVFNGGIYIHTSLYSNRRIQERLIKIDPETMESTLSIQTPSTIVLWNSSTGFLASRYVLNNNKRNYIYYFESRNKTVRIRRKYLKGLPEAIAYPYVLHENKTFILRGSTLERYWILQMRTESFDIMEYYPSKRNWVKIFEFPLWQGSGTYLMAERIIVTPKRLLFFDKEQLHIYPLDMTGEEQHMPFVTNDDLLITDYDSQNDRALICAISDTDVSYLLINKLSE
jgi:hypothetical protein